MRRKPAATVVWDGGTEDFLCRDERCTIYEVHLVHDINDTPEVLAARQYLYGWMFDPVEPCRKAMLRELGKPKAEDVTCPRCGAPPDQSCDTPSGKPHRGRQRQSPEWLASKLIVHQPGTADRRTSKPLHVQVLDESILRAITPYTIKPYAVIEAEVHNDYGSCAHRRLHRRLAALRKEGSIAYLRLGSEMISGYTKPGSPLLDDLPHAEEIIWRQLGDLGVREAA